MDSNVDGSFLLRHHGVGRAAEGHWSEAEQPCPVQTAAAISPDNVTATASVCCLCVTVTVKTQCIEAARPAQHGGTVDLWLLQNTDNVNPKVRASDKCLKASQETSPPLSRLLYFPCPEGQWYFLYFTILSNLTVFCWSLSNTHLAYHIHLRSVWNA